MKTSRRSRITEMATMVLIMANEDKKDFNAMLHDSKDMPKFQTITDEKA